MSQGRYWILTIPHANFLPFQHEPVQYIKGQLESGNDSGYLHWQLLVAFKTKVRLGFVKRLYGDQCHAELTKSSAANDYVWKDDTSVVGTRFELGQPAFKRNSQADWDAVLRDAKRGRLDDIPADVVVRHYGNLRRIAMDHLQPLGIEREIVVFWGATGTGKSRRAWNEAGLDAYPKDPRTKFWVRLIHMKLFYFI